MSTDQNQAAPVVRADGMPKSAAERLLRRLLAVRVGMPGTYYDDGEASGAENGISIDYMREPVVDIAAKLQALNEARAVAIRLADQNAKKEGCVMREALEQALEALRKYMAWIEAEEDHSKADFYQRLEMCRESDAAARSAIAATEAALAAAPVAPAGYTAQEWHDAKLRGIASDYFPDAKDWPAAMRCMQHLLMEQRKTAPAAPVAQPLTDEQAELKTLQGLVDMMDEPYRLECCGHGQGGECCMNPEPVGMTYSEFRQAVESRIAALRAHSIGQEGGAA